MYVAVNVLAILFNIFIISIMVYLYVNNYISGYTILGVILLEFFIGLIFLFLVLNMFSKTLQPKIIIGEKFNDNDKKINK